MRDEIITVRLTKAEKEELDKVISELGMTRSSFMRFLVKTVLRDIERLKKVILLEQAKWILQEQEL
ncbi:MAG: hypothetical protein DRJ18_01405 [Candidatus Methanomethylicota archaeon]|nr:MAG: hypothetical protein DRJ18_01405 [Candidatus Verstraetearchaeota archaeon]